MIIPKYVNLKILAVTTMKRGICVAGISDSFSWYRPVRKKGLNLLKDHIFQKDVCVLKNYNIVKFKMHKELSNNPHSEDFLIDWSHPPEVVGSLCEQDRKDLFNRIDETFKIKNISIPYFLLNNKRSLMLIRPDKILKTEWKMGFEGHQTRIHFQICSNKYFYPCTDLRWKAFGANKDNQKKAVDLLNTEKTYFAIGLTRIYRDKYYPIIVGVHTLSDLNLNIDYENLLNYEE